MHKLNNILLGLFAFFLLSFVFVSNSYADVITLDNSYQMAGMLDYVATKFNEVVLNETDSNIVLSILDYLQDNNNYDTEIYVYYIVLSKDGKSYNVLRYNKSDSNKPWYINVSSSGNGYSMTYSFTKTDVSNVFLNNDNTIDYLSDFSTKSTTYTACFGLYTDSKTTPYRTLYTGYDIPSNITYTYIPLYSSEDWGCVYYYYSGSWHNGTEVVVNPILSVPSEEPTLPTNQEIASAVQKFYNSDIYKNNTNFKDFMVVYSSFKNTYAFIGTDNHMLQEIFYDGVNVPGVNFSSSDTWWRFNSKFGDVQSFLFGSKFYLYFIEGNSDLITNEGIGTLYDLFDLKFTTGMTIVYSTYDYDVIEYRPPAEGETDNQVTQGTIEGDSYTYNENVDPTDSQYSPLQNFVSSNPTQSILNDVDFDSINQAFEDSKVILNIENANWIFTANNQLVEYFIGFITLLIILLVISRIMGG